MNSPNRRSLEVDFFRGVVLLVIAVDHISGSVLSRFTLHSYAFCDSVQPYLSAVLPMYAMYALAVPFVVPLAQRKPVVVLFGSLDVWLFASSLAQWLPSAYAEGWSFNPFAGQLMFALGILARVQPIPAEFHDSKTARWMTHAAIVVFSDLRAREAVPGDPGAPRIYEAEMKQNLASLRIVSFVVIAWLFAQAVHAGWIKALAKSLPSVVNIGKQRAGVFHCGRDCRNARQCRRMQPTGVTDESASVNHACQRCQEASPARNTLYALYESLMSRVSHMHSTPSRLIAAATGTYPPTHAKPPRFASNWAMYGATPTPPEYRPTLYGTPAPV